MEEQLQKSERKRRQSEQALQLQKAGRTPEQVKINELLKLQESLESMLEAKAFRRICQVLETQEKLLNTTEQLREIDIALDANQTVASQIQQAQKQTVALLTELKTMMQQEFDDRSKARTLENETLTKLNQYLDEWV